MVHRTNEIDPVQTRTLANGAVWSLDPAGELRVRVLRGVVWITQAGNAADYVLTAGQSKRFARRGRVVIEALQPAWIAVEPADMCAGRAVNATSAVCGSAGV